MPTLPSPIWLLAVYGYNELTRLDEYKARITCTFGSILKMDSTKKECGQLVVRLDIWHLMRNVAGGVTRESHELYPAFRRQLSLCIFEVDPGDARHLFYV
ncbi:hypothetical protein JOQ06_024042 [Pogonophryne albipinna]|uniref:Uncharacterized protein n=1 Tax=Pogonophryne albipinna TaxID=1090488 RepID=A0AAD6BKC6_9TELE|nr:hypothetical protein JOQ06_024042 [Pogonophryne albipinna]